MKTLQVLSATLFSIFAFSQGSFAQQSNINLSYVPEPQWFVSLGPSNANVLGLRTGMTISQALAVAKKSYKNNPSLDKGTDNFSYNGVTVHSDPYVQDIQIEGGKGNAPDTLNLFFSSPVTGNRIYSINRSVSFFAGSVQNYPLKSTITTALIKKYGPPSFGPAPYRTVDNTVLMWEFTKKGKVSCTSSTCATPADGVAKSNNLDSVSSPFQSYCNLPADSKQVITSVVSAWITPPEYTSSKTRAGGLSIFIWNPQACANDYRESIKQIKSAAMNAAPKQGVAAAPKL